MAAALRKILLASFAATTINGKMLRNLISKPGSKQRSKAQGIAKLSRKGSLATPGMDGSTWSADMDGSYAGPAATYGHPLPSDMDSSASRGSKAELLTDWPPAGSNDPSLTMDQQVAQYLNDLGGSGMIIVF